jgi:hypothetical protein
MAMRAFYSLLLAAVASLPFQAWSEEKIPPETRDRVAGFLEWFIDPGKTASEQVALFTDDVDYYDRGKVGKPAIMKDIGYSVRRWPMRSFRLAGIDYMRRDPADEDRIFVSYRIEFEVANPTQSIAGTATYAALIVDPDGEPKIEAIAEKVLKRNRLAAEE